MNLVITVVKALTVIVLAAWLCYDHVIYGVFLLPYIVISLFVSKRRYREEQRWRLNLGFGDAIRAISAALESGYSVEHAVDEAYRDMLLLYEEEEPIMRELAVASIKLKNSVPVEEVFTSMALRSGLEDIRSFATVFGIAKRGGGNLIEVIGATAGIIRTRVEVKRELKTAIAGRRYELLIMEIMVPGVLLYVRICMSELTAPLYNSSFGAVFMTIMLIVYAAACVLAHRLTEVEL